MVELAWLCSVEKPLPGSIMVGVGSRMLSGDRERVDSKWSILDVVLLLLLVKMGYDSSDTRFVAADCVRVLDRVHDSSVAKLPVFHRMLCGWDESLASSVYTQKCQ